jgi:type VI protein secretion system component VasK
MVDGHAATETERSTARMGRRAALVIAATMVLWLAAQALGAALDWPAQSAFLFDFAALAGLVWALAVTYRMWRARRASRAGSET